MKKKTYKYIDLKDFRRGINMEPENVEPGQVLDARNVWAPNGTLVQRPGLIPVHSASAYTGLRGISDRAYVWAHVDSDASTVIASQSGAGSLVFNTAVPGQYLYLGFAEEFYDVRLIHGVQELGANGFRCNTANTNATKYKAEYYNGSEWKPLFLKFNTLVIPTTGAEKYWNFSIPLEFPDCTWVPPNDWAVGDPVALGSMYYLRIKFLETALVDPTTIQNVDMPEFVSPLLDTGAATSLIVPLGLGQARFDGGVRLYWKFFANSLTVAEDWPTGKTYTVIYTGSGSTESTGRPSTATLPQFRRLFLAWKGELFDVPYPLIFSSTNSTSSTTMAAVETDTSLVGTNAPYDVNSVAQLAIPPKPHYITQYNGVLFAARLLDGGESIIRWTAAGQGFRVWPEESFADLAEDDNSPITGLTSLNEFPVVFKQDSIWNMVYTGTSELDEGNSGGLPIFTPSKVVHGVGTVANSSIVRTPIGLFFLAEDGIYVYDGQQATKISYPVDPLLARLSSKVSDLASAVYWKERNAYLIALPIDGSGENNIVLVYDLKHQAWWVWEDLGAQVLVNLEDASDKTQIQFLDNFGRIMQLHDGHDDYGVPISAYVETHRISGDGIQKITCREVRVNSENSSPVISVEVIPEDDTSASISGALDYTDLNGAEPEFGTAVFDTDAFEEAKRKDRRLGVRVRGAWFRVKLSMAISFVKLVVHKISLGVVEK